MDLAGAGPAGGRGLFSDRRRAGAPAVSGRAIAAARSLLCPHARARDVPDRESRKEAPAVLGGQRIAGAMIPGMPASEARKVCGLSEHVEYEVIALVELLLGPVVPAVRVAEEPEDPVAAV